MAGAKRGKPFEMRVTEIEDPLPDATFGSIGRYVEVAFPDQHDEPVVPQRLALGFDEKQAEHVDLWSLMLFRVELDSRTFTPVESSRVNVGKREVTAWVNQPGTYGLIGLPKHKAILETLRLFDRFGPQLLEERDRGEHGLHDRICGLILCADPNPWGDDPTGPGNLCTKCIGLDLSYGLLPERYLLERPPDISTFREHVDDEPAGAPSLLAWGGNNWGDLGDGTKIMRGTPVWVAPLLKPKKIIGGGLGDWGHWTLALSTDGTVWSWGHNVAGQLGNGTFSPSSVPGRVGSLANIVDIAAGTDHGLAVGSDGSVWRWGASESSSSAASPDSLPVRIGSLSDVVAVAAGHRFNLALRNDGRVFAWGDNSVGQLGDGSGAFFRANPAQVPGLTAVRSIAAGSASSFAIKSNGSVVAWGAGGTLGDGATVNRLIPVPVPGLSNIEQISASDNGLARTTAGEVWFWGTNFYGESGDGTVSGRHLVPVRVPGLPVITDIAVGGPHNLAFQSNGTVWAWGSGILGEIGIGTVWSQSSPIAVPLPGGRRASSVGAGWRSSFAIIA